MGWICWFKMCHWEYIGEISLEDTNVGLWQCRRCKTISRGRIVIKSVVFNLD